jgi:hypothetical protein
MYSIDLRIKTINLYKKLKSLRKTSEILEISKYLQFKDGPKEYNKILKLKNNTLFFKN